MEIETKVEEILKDKKLFEKCVAKNSNNPSWLPIPSLLIHPSGI